MILSDAFIVDSLRDWCGIGGLGLGRRAEQIGVGLVVYAHIAC